MNAPYIPESAPFSIEQRAWLNGYLAGLYSSSQATQVQAEEPKTAVSILWGSQTGNCEALAKKASKVLSSKGFAPTVHDLGTYQTELLAKEKLVLIITSTYGEGEPPDNAAAFCNWLMSDAPPSLQELSYSVLALGDSNYPDFCQCGIEIDERMKALGAKPIVGRVDCDVDFDEEFESWLRAVQTAAGDVSEQAESQSLDESEASEVVAQYGKKNPFPARLLRNVNLNLKGSAKETRHLEFSLEGSGLSYEPGDALAVVPRVDPGYVTDLLSSAGFSGSEPVGSKSLVSALQEDYDCVSLSLKVLKGYAALSGKVELEELAADRSRFKDYAWGRQIIDLLLEHPYDFASVEQFLGLLGKLSPRLYSISSSERAHEQEVHATVAVVRYESHGRERKGICSSFLAECELETPVHVFFHPSKTFKLPENPDTPVIMIGPGTGIAPFRAFLEEREAIGATGKNWLFFGDQHESCDFLYREELKGFEQRGILSRLNTAFSRDQKEKIYVQDRILQEGESVFAWLEAGACIYVCGDASRMAKDVDAAIRTLVAQCGDMSEAEADAYVDGLKKNRRYLRDVY